MTGGDRTSRLLRAGLPVALWLIAAGTLANALVAGRAMAGDWSVDVHAGIGNGLFTLAVVAVVLAVATRAPRGTLAWVVLLAVAVAAQVGLGYSGRTSTQAAAWHLPNGVAIFGMAVWAAAGARRHWH